MTRHRIHNILKEEPAVWKTFGLLSGCGLLVASVWLVSQIRAQEASPQTPWAQPGASPGTSSGGANPFSRSVPSAPDQTGDVARLRIQDALRQAHHALDAGDRLEALRQARRAEQIALQWQVTFAPGEENPRDLAAQLAGDLPSGSLAATGPTQPQSELKLQATRLVEEANAALQAGDLDTAHAKATEAANLNVAFGPFETQPFHILTAISSRQQASPIGPSREFAPSWTQTASNPLAQPATANTLTGTPRTPADEARELVSLARTALSAGHYDQARTLALRAQELNIVYNDVFEDRPENILRDIERQSGTSVFSPQRSTGAISSAESLRGQALQLLAEARQLLQSGDLEGARGRVQAAEALDATYELNDERPDIVWQDIRTAEARQFSTASSDAWATNPGSTNPSVEEQTNLARQWMSQAEAALASGDLVTARTLAQRAAQYDDNVTYELSAKTPDVLLTQISALEAGRANSIAQGQTPRGPLDVTSSPSSEYFAPGVPGTPRSNNLVIQTDGRSALELYNQGVQYLRDGDRQAAYQTFLAAYETGETLDPVRQHQLEDKIQQLASSQHDIQTVSNESANGGFGQSSPLDSEVTRQSLVFDRLRTETMNTIFHAERLRENEPQQSLRMLEEQLTAVQNSELTPQQTAPLVRQIQSARTSLEAYATQRAPLLELQNQNEEVLADIERRLAHQARMEQDLANLIDEYNELMEQRRYPEAHHVAVKAMELDPTNPVSVQAELQSRFALRVDSNERLQDAKEEMFWQALDDVEWGLARGIPTDANPLQYADDWDDIINGRRPSPIDGREHSEAEERVRESLQSPVNLHFENVPLSSVMQHISDRYGINVVVDEPALNEVGVMASELVTINVDDIKLKSALDIMLSRLELSHVIDHEVLMITSRLRQQGDMAVITYGVGDLVVPITTRASNPSVWMQPGTGYGIQSNGFEFNGFNGGMQQVPVDPLSPLPGIGGGAANAPKAQGGPTQADFDALIHLITEVVGPGSWSEVGGQGSIDRHPSTLSLIVRQTQSVHQEIRDLLEQLRRLQDLQVTIEVRFITVSDSFFEQIGIDFDFNVQDTIGGPFVDDTFNPISPFGSTDPVNGVQGGGAAGMAGQAGQAGVGLLGPTAPFGMQPTLNVVGRDNWPNRTVVGLAAPNTFSGDLDIPFRQGSFDLGAPPFGGFQETAGITFGMAILSDLEAFLFVRAAQGDRRSNIMFAPKITLFNGQAGSLFSGTVQPFVVALIPVASAFAIGFQPIIQQIPQGVFMSVAAVVSADRRYVRLAVFPQFSNITDVFTFSFIGGIGGGGGGGGQFGGGGGQFGGGGGGGGGGGFFAVPDPRSMGTLGGGGIGGGQFAIAGSGQSFGTQGQGGQGGQQGQQGQQGGGAGSVTLQQPVVDIVTIDTVVSVPDGGTVLLGGVKRLSEGRNMAGVPILNKIPYVSRLFKNSGVGRETESLMLMVTPRIIIQEELEDALFGPER